MANPELSVGRLLIWLRICSDDVTGTDCSRLLKPPALLNAWVRATLSRCEVRNDLARA